VEILKQPQYEPMPLERQGMIIYVATTGYLDDLPMSSIKRFEKEFYAFMDDKYPDVGLTIRRTGKFDEQTEETLKRAATEFKAQFKPDG